ncbi:MAG: hypothetical protein OEZ43_06965 [Gammaproteobacteria bacterium]|nr:hypothetical protein [Gammaproteobacteria bacterium]
MGIVLGRQEMQNKFLYALVLSVLVQTAVFWFVSKVLHIDVPAPNSADEGLILEFSLLNPPPSPDLEAEVSDPPPEVKAKEEPAEPIEEKMPLSRAATELPAVDDSELQNEPKAERDDKGSRAVSIAEIYSKARDLVQRQAAESGKRDSLNSPRLIKESIREIEVFDTGRADEHIVKFNYFFLKKPICVKYRPRDPLNEVDTGSWMLMLDNCR